MLDGIRRQSAPWEILPKEESLFSFLPGQAVAVVLKLTLPPAVQEQHTHCTQWTDTHTHTLQIVHTHTHTSTDTRARPGMQVRAENASVVDVP